MNVPNHEKKAFRDMTPEERAAIVEAKLSGNCNWLVNDAWLDSDEDGVVFSFIYRTRPRQLVIPWEHIKPEYKWARLDENGEIWFFAFNPYDGADFWGDTNNYCRSALIINTTGIDWRESLTARPEGV